MPVPVQVDAAIAMARNALTITPPLSDPPVTGSPPPVQPPLDAGHVPDAIPVLAQQSRPRSDERAVAAPLRTDRFRGQQGHRDRHRIRVIGTEHVLQTERAVGEGIGALSVHRLATSGDPQVDPDRLELPCELLGGPGRGRLLWGDCEDLLTLLRVTAPVPIRVVPGPTHLLAGGIEIGPRIRIEVAQQPVLEDVGEQVRRRGPAIPVGVSRSEQSLAIDGVRRRPPHVDRVERRLRQIDADEPNDRALADVHLNRRLGGSTGRWRRRARILRRGGT